MEVKEDFRIMIAGKCNPKMKIIPLEDFTEFIRSIRTGKMKTPIKKCIECNCIIPKHNKTGYCRICYRNSKELIAKKREWARYWKKEYLKIAKEEINNYYSNI